MTDVAIQEVWFISISANDDEMALGGGYCNNISNIKQYPHKKYDNVTKNAYLVKIINQNRGFGLKLLISLHRQKSDMLN